MMARSRTSASGSVRSPVAADAVEAPAVSLSSFFPRLTRMGWPDTDRAPSEAVHILMPDRPAYGHRPIGGPRPNPSRLAIPSHSTAHGEESPASAVLPASSGPTCPHQPTPGWPHPAP